MIEPYVWAATAGVYLFLALGPFDRPHAYSQAVGFAAALTFALVAILKAIEANRP